ncbi:MAG: hypothetical protein PSX37_10505 [bacterium]|nr:hypothetical protein [bacterium]
MRGIAVAAPIAVVRGLAGAGSVAADENRATPLAITSISFTMSGYANLARDVPRYQLGQVYLDGRGTIQKGGAMSGGTSTRNAYLEYPEATIQTQIIGLRAFAERNVPTDQIAALADDMADMLYAYRAG